MKLSIATNWQPDLIEALAPYPIGDLYGSLPKTPVGSGRPAMFLPGISREDAASHIRSVLQSGWQFNYLFNGMCVDGRTVAEIERDLLSELEWVQSLGVTTVTAAHPYVLMAVKKHFPQLRVKMSIFTDLSSVNKVLAFEEMGADDIALSMWRNRDFEYLNAVAKATSCGLTVLVNQACLYMCAHRLNHGAVNAHASVNDCEEDGFGINYVLIKCAQEKLRRPSALIKSRLIRPEDVPLYEAIGIDTFKIAGREMDTPWLVNAAKAYSQKRHDGNFSDLLNGIAVMVSDNQKDRRMPYIDNRALDGFIAHFASGRCIGNCDKCGYCERVAARVVKLYADENQAFLHTLEMMKDMML